MEKMMPSFEGRDSSFKKQNDIKFQVDRLLEMAERKSNFRQKIRLVELKYAESVYLKQKGQQDPAADFGFAAAVFVNTSCDPKFERILKAKSEQGEEVLTSKENFLKELNSIYVADGLEGASNFLDEYFKDLEKEDASNEGSGEMAGVIEFGSPDQDKDGKYYLSLHLPALVRYDHENIPSYEDSLKILAAKLVEKGQYLDYIKRYTWMADMDKSVRYGFEKIEREEFNPATDGMSVWGQFIKKDGSLNGEAVAYLLEKGEPRYMATSAKM